MLSKLYLPDGASLYEAREFMGKGDTKIVICNGDAYMVFKEHNNLLFAWKSAAIFINEETV
jgi:hypothetical protein